MILHLAPINANYLILAPWTEFGEYACAVSIRITLDGAPVALRFWEPSFQALNSALSA
jgi:hypothetical protein